MNKINRDALQAIVGMAQNSTISDGKLITDAELAELKQMIVQGSLPVWKLPGGTSLGALRGAVEKMPLLPAERQATLAAIDALEELGNTHASNTRMGAQFRAMWHRLAGTFEKAVD